MQKFESSQKYENLVGWFFEWSTENFEL